MKRAVTTTYLEMRNATDAVAFGGVRQLEVRCVEIPSPELSRFFYSAVGADWWWYSRLPWSEAEWTAWVDRPALQTWVGYLQGTPVGYFELEAQPGPEVELVYFGLLPQFIGRGIGAELLCEAVTCAWASAPRRVWVHTCTLDHPRALPGYQARGFEIYREEEDVEELPDEPPSFWPQPSIG